MFKTVMYGFILACITACASPTLRTPASKAQTDIVQNVVWTCAPLSSSNEGSFELHFDGKAPISTLFATTDSQSAGDGLDGLTVAKNPMGESPINWNDETEVGPNESAFDVKAWGNNLPTNKGGISYTLILPNQIGTESKFPATLWKAGPAPTKVKYSCSRSK